MVSRPSCPSAFKKFLLQKSEIISAREVARMYREGISYIGPRGVEGLRAVLRVSNLPNCDLLHFLIVLTPLIMAGKHVVHDWESCPQTRVNETK